MRERKVARIWGYTFLIEGFYERILVSFFGIFSRKAFWVKVG